MSRHQPWPFRLGFLHAIFAEYALSGSITGEMRLERRTSSRPRSASPTQGRAALPCRRARFPAPPRQDRLVNARLAARSRFGRHVGGSVVNLLELAPNFTEFGKGFLNPSPYLACGVRGERCQALRFNRKRAKLKQLLGIRARLALLAVILVAPLMLDRARSLEDTRSQADRAGLRRNLPISRSTAPIPSAKSSPRSRRC